MGGIADTGLDAREAGSQVHYFGCVAGVRAFNNAAHGKRAKADSRGCSYARSSTKSENIEEVISVTIELLDTN